MACCRKFDSIPGPREPWPSTGFALSYLNSGLTKSLAEKDKGMSAEPVPEAAQPERLTALSCLDVRPLIKGYFSALRGSWVRSCLWPSFAENRIR
jgi:hypothetical protein